MTQPLQLAEHRIEQPGLLREALEIIGRMRRTREPITTPVGLRQSIEVVLNFARLAGMSAESADRLRPILSDENIFAIVLSILRFLLGESRADTEEGGKPRVSVNGSGAIIINPRIL